MVATGFWGFSHEPFGITFESVINRLVKLKGRHAQFAQLNLAPRFALYENG
jgi:hypothetical protein